MSGSCRSGSFSSGIRPVPAKSMSPRRPALRFRFRSWGGAGAKPTWTATAAWIWFFHGTGIRQWYS